MCAFALYNSYGFEILSSSSYYLHERNVTSLKSLTEYDYHSNYTFPLLWSEAQNLDTPTIGPYSKYHKRYIFNNDAMYGRVLFTIKPLSVLLNCGLTIFCDSSSGADFIYEHSGNCPELYVGTLTNPEATNNSFGLQTFDADGNVYFDAMSKIIHPISFHTSTFDVSNIDAAYYGIIVDSQYMSSIKVGSNYLYGNKQLFFTFDGQNFGVRRRFLYSGSKGLQKIHFPQSKMHYNDTQNFLLYKI